MKKLPELVYLYVGCGNHRLRGFTHVEVNPMKQFKNGGDVGQPEILANITETLPLEDQSVSLIFSRATLEHLTYPELINHFIECNRLLKNDAGYVRIIVPDLDKMVQDYLNKVFRPAGEPDPNLPCENHTDYFITRLLYHDHYYLHNEDTITRALEKTGFGEVKVCQPGETAVAMVSNILYDAELNREEDLIIEAKKISLPSVEKTSIIWPQNILLRTLANWFNVKIGSYKRRQPVFPSKYWFLGKVQQRKFKVVDAKKLLEYEANK